MKKSCKANVCAEQWGLFVLTTAGTALYRASSIKEAVNIISSGDAPEIEPKVTEQILPICSQSEPLPSARHEDAAPSPSERSGGDKTDDEEPAKTEKGKEVEDDKEPAPTEPRKEAKDDKEPDAKEEEDKGKKATRSEPSVERK